MEKEILAVIRRIEKFLIFLAPNPFLSELIEGNNWFCEKEFIKYVAQVDNYGLTSFFLY